MPRLVWAAFGDVKRFYVAKRGKAQTHWSGFLVPGRVVAVFVADAAFGIARTYKLSFEEGWYFASSQVTQATRNIIYSAFAGCRLPFVDTVLNIRASHSGVDSSRLFLLMFPAGVTQ